MLEDLKNYEFKKKSKIVAIVSAIMPIIFILIGFDYIYSFLLFNIFSFLYILNSDILMNYKLKPIIRFCLSILLSIIFFTPLIIIIYYKNQIGMVLAKLSDCNLIIDLIITLISLSILFTYILIPMYAFLYKKLHNFLVSKEDAN